MESLKRWWRKHRKFLIIFLIIYGILLLFTSHDEVFYHQPIGKVVSAKTIRVDKQTDEFKNVDYQIEQRLKVKIMNGKNEGRTVYVKNRYSGSRAISQKYQIGQEGFLTQVKVGKKGTANINGLKRDTILVFLFGLTVLLLICLLGTSGGLALVSILLNTLLFVIAVLIDIKLQASLVLLIFSILALLLALITLIFIFGTNSKMVLALCSTVIGTSLAMLVCVVVMALTSNKGVYYESMQYVTQSIRPLFLAEVMLGSLGAVMDECSDIVVTVYELKRVSPEAKYKELYKAGMTVGKSIMGPLVNVLLMIFLFSTLTNSLLYLKNGNSWGYTFNMCISLGMVQSLVAGIGIVITCPVISGLSALYLGGGKR